MTEKEELIKKAKELFEKNQHTETVELLTDALLEKHNDSRLYFRRGYANGELQEYDKAIADYTKNIELKKDDAGAYNNRGNAWRNKAEYDRAIADYDTAIELKKDYAIAYYNRGLARYYKGEYDKAIDDYDTAIKLKNDYTDAYMGRGVIWYNKSEYDKAIADYTEAILLKKDYADAYYNRGLAWNNKGEYDKAIEDYDNTIELKNDHSNAYYGRGLAWNAKGNYKKTLADYEKKIELTKSNPDYYTGIANSKIEELKELIAGGDLSRITELVNSIKNLLQFKDVSITHYTGLSTAKALILEGSLLRLSEGTYLNDTSEGRELFKFLDVQFSQQRSSDVIEPFAQKPFIGSFVHESKNDDLTLWRMYGKEAKEEAKGCSITIHMKKLVDGIMDKLIPDKTVTSKTADDINFYYVAYKKYDGSFDLPGAVAGEAEKLNGFMQELAKIVKPYKESIENKTDKTDDKKKLEELLNDIAFLFKNSEYMHEYELRLVVKGIGFDKKINMEPTPPRVYVELTGIKPMIEKITLGPKVERADEWVAAFYYSLEKDGYKPQILISHLPFK